MSSSRWTNVGGFMWATISLALASAGEVDTSFGAEARASSRLIRREDATSLSMLPASYLQIAEDGDAEDSEQQEVPDGEAKAVKMLQDLMDVESDMADEFKAKAADTSTPTVSTIRPESPNKASDARSQDAKTTSGTQPSTNSNSADSPAGLAATVATATVSDTSALPTPDELADVSSFDLNPAIQDIWEDVAAGNKLGTARAKRKAKAAAKASLLGPVSGTGDFTMLSAAQELGVGSATTSKAKPKTVKKHKAAKKSSDADTGKKSGESKADPASLYDANNFGTEVTFSSPTADPAANAINDPEADIVGSDGQWPGWSDDEPAPM